MKRISVKLLKEININCLKEAKPQIVKSNLTDKTNRVRHDEICQVVGLNMKN